MKDFGDIQFGFASAHTESAEAPDLLLHGFMDHRRLTHTALEGVEFLFLGYKGSGKTALAQRAKLLASRDPELFVTTATLDEFSYTDFQAFAGGAGDYKTRYPTAWAWSLLLVLVQSLERDEGGRSQAPPEYTRVLDGLRMLDLLPLPELRQLVTRSSKRGFKATIPKFLEFTEERVLEGQDLQLSQMVRILREAVTHFPTRSRHLVFIDGLDDVLTEASLQFNALSALISEVSLLNAELRAAGRPFKFVVLCRADIFEKLPGGNMNKIRQDGSVMLDWFEDPRNPDRTLLVELVNLRACRSLGREVNVFDEVFPRTVDGAPVRRYLLDHTRHLPRDVLQLMRYLQRFSSGRHPRLTEDEIKSGIRDYSNNYFVPELRDELDGYLDRAQIDSALRLLTSLGRNGFTKADLEAQVVRLGIKDLDVELVLNTLFDCSGIGMREHRDGPPRYTFKYRNRNAMLILDRKCVVHRGAHKALNIESSGGPRPGGKGRRGGGRQRPGRTRES